ncbi:MAG: aldo/keto reductase [Caldilineaceae bacterium]
MSVMGLGCGGPSRIGQSADKGDANSIAIVRAALEAGVNFFDTAEAYRTETLVGEALKGVDRDSFVISTKKSYRNEISPALVRQGLEESLQRLQMDYVDIYNLHGVGHRTIPCCAMRFCPPFPNCATKAKSALSAFRRCSTKTKSTR